MNISIKKIFVALVVLLSSAIFNGSDASALTFSPAIKEYSSNPGDSIAETLRLYNDTDTDKTYYPVYYDFTAPKDESGSPMFVAEGTMATSSSLASWFRRLQPVFIKARGKQEVLMNIDVPQSAEPGGHYGALLFSDQPTDISNTNIGVGSQTGPLVLVNVFGDIKEGLEILNFDTGKVRSSLPVDFTLRLNNTGSVHQTPVGNITIKGWWPKETIVPVNAQKLSHVLPHSVRKLNYAWAVDDKRPAGFLDMIRYEWQNFAIGRFRAVISLDYGIVKDGNVSAETSFWLFPYHLLTASLLVLAAIYGLLKIYTNLVISRAQSSSRKPKITGKK
jgi:hypothetical protein